ncbi:hypothetical protein [Pseudorhodobacter ferrugineus]|uniref:hypothetical protein n=1 Tax=Pseudorhodobacter ferrugineus TaxID=77008 RepID=UPI0003FB3289|nr:hypothetical protein [Pseudorhodobacter ferrugineus]
MTVEMIDGIRVMKLNDRAQRAVMADDTLTMVHIWRLLSGGHALRDTCVGCRQFL